MPTRSSSARSSSKTGSSGVPAMRSPRSRIGWEERWASWNGLSMALYPSGFEARSVPAGLEPFRGWRRSEVRSARSGLHEPEETMKKLVLLVSAVLLGSLPAAADEAGIHLDFPVGELQVAAASGREVQVQVRLECDSKRQTRCVNAAGAVELTATTSGDRLHVGLMGWPKTGTRGLEAHVVVSVPRDLPLRAELGVGEMRISGLTSDVDADLGVGE